MSSRKNRDSTYLIKNPPSDRVDAPSSSTEPESKPSNERWRTSNPPPGESLEAKWWPDEELGRAFRRWTDIPPAGGESGRSVALKFLVEHLNVTGLTAIGTAPRTALPSIAPPDFASRVKVMVTRLGLHGPNEDAPDHRALLDLGEEVLPTLQELFPGRLWFSRWEPHVRPPKGRSISGLCRTLVAFGDAAVPYVAELLQSDNADVRYYAVLVAAELPHPLLIEPVAAALFDDDQGVSRSALYALELFHELRGIDSVKESLCALATEPKTDQRTRLLAMRALAVLRDHECVGALIPALSEHGVLGEAAWRVLRMLTAQDFGTDTDAWRAWWDRNSGRSRVEWLIESLDHDEEEIREIVARELARQSKQDFGYRASLSSEERRAIRERYRVWWASQGEND